MFLHVVSSKDANNNIIIFYMLEVNNNLPHGFVIS